MSHEDSPLLPDALTPFFHGGRETAKGEKSRVGGVVIPEGCEGSRPRTWLGGPTVWEGRVPPPHQGKNAEKTPDASAQDSTLSFTGTNSRHRSLKRRGCQGTVTHGPSLHQVHSRFPCGSQLHSSVPDGRNSEELCSLNFLLISIY